MGRCFKGRCCGYPKVEETKVTSLQEQIMPWVKWSLGLTGFFAFLYVVCLLIEVYHAH
jgi:hypothetical protein